MIAEFGTGQVLWSIIWFFLFFMWIMLLFEVFADVFRSDDLGGFAKVMWLLFVIVVPYLGVFVYLIARGHKMSERKVRDAQAQEAAIQQYIRQTAGSGGPSPADELERLAQLRAQGVIGDEEFAQLKGKVVSQ